MSGATNCFNGLADTVLNRQTKKYDPVHSVARFLKERGIGTVVAGEENFGEGSSREHAAMEPRFLNVKAIIVKSFARIHETNLKKQGVLTLTFAVKADYTRIREDDKIDITGLKEFNPGKQLTMVLYHSDGTSESFPVNHSYSNSQIEWFRAGSALNIIRRKGEGERGRKAFVLSIK
jgi:aconitate hydratase